MTQTPAEQFSQKENIERIETLQTHLRLHRFLWRTELLLLWGAMLRVSIKLTATILGSVRKHSKKINNAHEGGK